MYRVYACLTQEHSYGLVLAAALACVVGACLSAIMAQRLLNPKGRGRLIHILLAGIIAGATIWATHFIAMLAYDTGVEHWFETQETVLSLIVAVVGMSISFGILSFSVNRRLYILSGAVFGVTVSCMHYVGMAGFLLPGVLIWNVPMQVASVVLGMSLGVAAHRSLVRSVDTRARWTVGAVMTVLAICSMHFTGMAAFELRLDSSIVVPPVLISDSVLALIIGGVTAVIYLIGFATVSIEMNLEQEARCELTYAANHDALTQLPNRMKLDGHLDALQLSLNDGRTGRVAVAGIDLNLFKEINDSLGHEAGDVVLIAVAKRMTKALQAGEFIARTGGDEFVAIKTDFRRIEEINAFAERLHGCIVEPIVIDGSTVAVGAAIGIATTIDDGDNLRDLFHKADLAMYRAKADNGAHICHYNVKIGQQSEDRLALIKDLREALASDQFELAYQFQNNVKTNEVVGFEALLRWNHPTRGRVSPADFIPLAEETGLIREIGLWVLRAACVEAASWPEPYTIAVNVAPQQLVSPSFGEAVADILLDTGLNPNRLELEVTEASIIDDQTHTLNVMRELQEMGVGIAMDDFGTGYSSLAMLQAFPFNKIKIDRSFVSDVHIMPKRGAIVRSTLLLAEAFGIQVIAEGVEKLEELNFLRQNNCDAVQGFYFGMPMDMDELKAAVGPLRTEIAS